MTKIYYFIAMPQPENHLFQVQLTIENWSNDQLELIMPVWTPGSYLIREYSRHLQDFCVFGQNTNLVHTKVSKNHWSINTKDQKNITIKYKIYANDLTVRTNHLDQTHGYFNPSALCFYIRGLEKKPINITIITPQPDWKISTALPAIKGEKNSFLARDFDTLADSPFEIGTHEVYDFEVLGKKHQFAIWGKGNYDAQKIINDTKKLIEIEAKMFGGLPYNNYLFLLHLAPQNNGGLEHKYSTTLNYNRLGFKKTDKYERFLQLVAHEFFHLWNIKRIRPKGLETFDYTAENYTPSLWFSEGTTSFYDLIIPHRAGIYDTKTYLDYLSKEITRLQTTIGRNFQPVSESSFDAWIKLYRPDANSVNSQISYYLKGEIVTFILDLLIRAKHENKRSFDDVMLAMWEKFGKEEIGFTPTDLKTVIETVADTDLTEFFHDYIDGTKEIPYNEYLQPFGLELKTNIEQEIPYLGLNCQSENNKEIIKNVYFNSPAQKGGIDVGDELLAIDGIKVTATQINDRLKDYKAGDRIEITVFHQDQLRTYYIILEESQPQSFQIIPIKNANEKQQQNFSGWLGTKWEKMGA
jgi:predicted metalloprotease with PDZ domain